MKNQKFINLTSYSVDVWRANPQEPPVRVKVLQRGENYPQQCLEGDRWIAKESRSGFELSLAQGSTADLVDIILDS